MTGFIYKITNKLNNKMYIGQTRVSLTQRFYDHCIEAKNGSNRPICQAIRKYKKENFIIELIEECDIQKLNERERYWIKYYNTYNGYGYNANLGGLGSNLYDYDKIWELLQQNKNNKEIQEIIKCSKDTIYDVCKLHSFRIKNDAPRDFVAIDKKTNKIIQNFDTVKQAEDWCLNNCYSKSKQCHTHIYACLKGKRKSAYGFIWRYNNCER